MLKKGRGPNWDRTNWFTCSPTTGRSCYLSIKLRFFFEVEKNGCRSLLVRSAQNEIRPRIVADRSESGELPNRPPYKAETDLCPGVAREDDLKGPTCLTVLRWRGAERQPDRFGHQG